MTTRKSITELFTVQVVHGGPDLYELLTGQIEAYRTEHKKRTGEQLPWGDRQVVKRDRKGDLIEIEVQVSFSISEPKRSAKPRP